MTIVILVFAVCMVISYLAVIFFGYQNRDNYARAVLFDVYDRFQAGLYYVDHFPMDEKEVAAMFDLVRKKEKTLAEMPYEFTFQYRIIENKENEVLFMIVVDSTSNIEFLTYKGSINTGLGRAKKDEKGEWHGTLEWFYKTSTVVDKF